MCRTRYQTQPERFKDSRVNDSIRKIPTWTPKDHVEIATSALKCMTDTVAWLSEDYEPAKIQKSLLKYAPYDFALMNLSAESVPV